MRQPPEVEGPTIVDTGHVLPASAYAHGGGFSVLLCPHLHGFGRLQRLDGVSSRRVHGHLQGTHLRGGMPRGHPGDGVEGVATSHQRSELPVDLYKTLTPVVAGVLQQFHLGPRIWGEVGQGEGHLLHGAGWGIRLQPASEDKRMPASRWQRAA